MAITAGKRRELRPVSFEPIQISIGDFLTFAGPNPYYPSSLYNIQLAYESRIGDSSGYNVVLGYKPNIGFQAYANFVVSLESPGGDKVGDYGSYNFVVGPYCSVASGGCYDNVLIAMDGYVSIGSTSSYNVCIGTGSSTGVGVGCYGNLVLNPEGTPFPGPSIGDGTQYSAAMGYSRVGMNSRQVYTLGFYVRVGDNCQDDAVIGGRDILLPNNSQLNNVIGSFVSLGGVPLFGANSNSVVGSYITLGAATLAFGTFENAGPAQFVDNDYITFPDGSGGTINVELQLTGAFVPTPGMFTADLQLAVTAQDVSDIIASVVFTNSSLQDLNNSVAYGIGWIHTYGYSTTGAVGNSGQIIPTVTNGAAAAIGSTFRDGADMSPTSNCSAMGDHITITPNSDRSVMVGSALTTGTDNSYSVIVGSGITLAQADWWSVVLGSINTMGFASPACILIGRQSSIGEHSFNTILLGTSSTIRDNSVFCAVLGGNNTLGTGHSGSYSACTILGSGNVIADDNYSIHEHGVGLTVNGISTFTFLAGTFNTLTTPGIVVAVGTAIVATVVNSTLIGDNLTTTTGSGDRLVLIGNYISTDGSCTADICIGADLTLDGDALGAIRNVFIGYSIAAIEPESTIALGDTIAIGLQAQSCIAVGHSATIGASLTAAIALGLSTSATGSYAIALGASATAAANTMIVGDNASSTTAMHQFTMRGYNGGVLDTISAIDNPADGSFGLSIVYNAGGTYINRTVKGAVSPPVGSILLYTDPYP